MARSRRRIIVTGRRFDASGIQAFDGRCDGSFQPSHRSKGRMRVAVGSLQRAMLDRSGSGRSGLIARIDDFPEPRWPFAGEPHERVRHAWMVELTAWVSKFTV
jgi:hypothetical protein